MEQGTTEEKRCETCGNRYAHCFEIVMEGESHFFDCFECAIHELAPSCATCGVMIMGHGMEADGVMFCCASCARAEGVTKLRDQANPVEQTSSP